MKMPFGKYKGKPLVDFVSSTQLKYLDWFLENCKKEISKYPEFEEWLEENFDYEKYKELPYSEKDYKDTSSGISTDGKMINNFEEYKEFVSKLYSEIYSGNWIQESQQKIYKTFGKPLEYPFIITLRKNCLDVYNNIEIHKIYLKDKPSIYTYSESYY